MAINGTALQHWIDNFYGYGAWEAPFWFVSLEESGGNVPEDVEERTNYFYAHKPENPGDLCDVRELYKHVGFRSDGPKATVFPNLNEYRFGSNAIQHGVWKNLIAFIHGYKNEPVPDLLSYQKNQFCLAAKPNEALISLYPLPSPHNHAWYYSWLGLPEFNYLKTRSAYQEHLLPQRINHILLQIGVYKPKVVVMYGMENITALKKSVQQKFAGTAFKQVQAIKLQIPQHHRTSINDTTLLITTQIPALRHNRIETGFDWQQLGAMTAVQTIK